MYLNTKTCQKLSWNKNYFLRYFITVIVKLIECNQYGLVGMDNQGFLARFFAELRDFFL
jgi:hypothetical protein